MSGYFFRWPKLRDALLEIGYDNGCINRCQSDEDWLSDCYERLASSGIVEDDLSALDRWLATLTKRQFQTMCCGETTQMERLADRKKVPKDEQGRALTRLLDIAFDGDTRD